MQYLSSILFSVQLCTAIHALQLRDIQDRADVEDPDIFTPHPDPDANSSIDFSTLFSGSASQSSPFKFLSTLFARQERTCPYPVKCDSTWCCPSGTNCCTFPTCCPTTSNCRPDLPGMCCPKSAETCGGKFCANAGSVCCTAHVCPQGYVCNEMGGFQQCCKSGTVKCPNACCPTGSICGPSPGLCRKAETEPDSDCSASDSLGQRGIEPRREVEFVKGYCPRICDVASKKNMTLWNIKKIKGETDELIESMCYGMYEKMKKGAKLLDGEDILEYNGPGKQNRNTQVNCRGFCREATKKRGIKTECDEYPPASLNSGKHGQTRMCIEGYQNSGTQGPMLGRIVQECGLKKAARIKVRIEGGCKSFNFEERDRLGLLNDAFLQSRSETLSLQASNATLRDPMGDGSLTYVALTTDELEDGHYDFTVSFDGPIHNVTVLDKYGESYAVSTGNNGKASLSFDVTDGDGQALAVIVYADKAVSVSYTATATLAGASSTSAPPSNMAMQRTPVFVPWYLVGMIYVGVAIIL